MSLYQQQLEKQERTRAFLERQKNMTTSEQIEGLLNSKVVSDKDTRNLSLFLKERNWTANTAPDNWSKPVKQTVLRQEIASESQEKTRPPKSKRPNPIKTPNVIIQTNTPEIVVPEYTDLNVITPDIKTPSAEMNPAKSATQEALDLPKENAMALYAILIGAGISGYYLMTRLGKKRGRK